MLAPLPPLLLVPKLPPLPAPVPASLPLPLPLSPPRLSMGPFALVPQPTAIRMAPALGRKK